MDGIGLRRVSIAEDERDWYHLNADKQRGDTDIDIDPSQYLGGFECCTVISKDPEDNLIN